MSVNNPNIGSDQSDAMYCTINTNKASKASHCVINKQWSPDNPEGKPQYDRNFLLEMQKNPLSLKRPDSLPSLEVVLDDSHKRLQKLKTPKILLDFTPSFLKNKSKGRGQKVVSRNSQQDRKTQRIIDNKLSSSSEVKLKTSENVCKSSTKKTNDKDESEAKHEELLKRMRGIHNKLTTENFDKLVTKVQALPMETILNLDGVIGLIFQKAVDEQAFSTTLAQLCQVLLPISAKENKKKSVKENKDKDELRFINLIINRCQKEFEEDNAKDLKRIEKEWKIESYTDDIIFTLDCATENAPVIEAVEPEFDAKKTRTELIKLFKRNASDEEIFGWVDANVGSHYNSKKFVRALTAALIESFFTTSLDGSFVVVGDDFEAKLRKKVKVVHRYVENSEKLELPCIFGMQSLCVEYQHPPGLLEQCFNVFYDKDILSEDSFIEWEKNEDPEEQVGKKACITSVRKFLKWLTEADAEDQQDYQNSNQK